MSYPAFGKVKTIVLPIPGPDASYTIEEYKKHFGIDLKEFVYLHETTSNYKSIRFNFGDSSVLLKVSNEFARVYGVQVCLAPIYDIETRNHVPGSQNCETRFIDNINDAILNFTIDKDVDFAIDNIVITSSEY